MFYIVVDIFRVVILLYSEQSLDEAVKITLRLRASEKPHNYIALCYFAFFCAKIRYVVLNGMTQITYFVSHRHRKYFCCLILGFNAFNISIPTFDVSTHSYLNLYRFSVQQFFGDFRVLIMSWHLLESAFLFVD